MKGANVDAANSGAVNHKAKNLIEGKSFIILSLQ